MLFVMAAAFQFFISHHEKVYGWLLEHLWISFVSILVAIFIGLACGLYITGKGRESLADVVLYITEILMTVPSLALFGLLMFVLSYTGFSAVGFMPAVITLIIYGQLPIVRNTYVAINNVEPSIIEAGKGMGMTEKQLLYKIKLPLAIPVIMAGIRNASILIIGIATIAALIGSGGLGVPIFRGLRNARMDLIILGGVLVSLLAISVDVFLLIVQRCLTPKGIRKSLK